VTSASGKIAIKVARMLGATRIVGAARNEAALKALGIDDYVVLKDTPTDTDFTVAAEADVVLDYLYGPWINAFLTSPTTKAATTPLTWVQIGSLAGMDGSVPAAGLRSRDVTVRGSGPGAWSVAELSLEQPGMLKVLVGVKEADVKEVRIEDVEEEWTKGGKGRTVFVFGK
jgi:NADPH:quinone reductase-like Zn-dependent oxidoreductase